MLQWCDKQWSCWTSPQMGSAWNDQHEVACIPPTSDHPKSEECTIANTFSTISILYQLWVSVPFVLTCQKNWLPTQHKTLRYTRRWIRPWNKEELMRRNNKVTGGQPQSNSNLQLTTQERTENDVRYFFFFNNVIINRKPQGNWLDAKEAGKEFWHHMAIRSISWHSAT